MSTPPTTVMTIIQGCRVTVDRTNLVGLRLTLPSLAEYVRRCMMRLLYLSLSAASVSAQGRYFRGLFLRRMHASLGTHWVYRLPESCETFCFEHELWVFER